ncbi:hypothetical protein FA15DRAFT_708302 [Coprinopsis marcescibilis]|uniref:Uncharacterized protein n=1 Tax=Coprinopsis marcescibilis TaxID=230819 RepID=A0A5C3KJ51_COPMA|nr:hypothetical protein FA15DRAFT_708302 [Coprinopsis marcescibilis]
MFDLSFNFFIKEASVDIDLGKKFVSTDYALYYVLRQHILSNSDAAAKYIALVDFLSSYDIACH